MISDGHGRIATREDEEQLEYQKDYILLYEDNEGDRMLVGDVPWEYVESSIYAIYLWYTLKWSLINLSCICLCRLFIASVKRLYITKDPRADKTRRPMVCVLYDALHYGYTTFFLTKFTAFYLSSDSAIFCSYRRIRCLRKFLCFYQTANYNGTLHTSTCTNLKDRRRSKYGLRLQWAAENLHSKL